MSTNAQIVKENAEWQANNDANTLAEAHIILSDDKRLKAAETAAEKLAEDAKERFEGMLRVANKGKTIEGMKVIERD